MNNWLDINDSWKGHKTQIKRRKKNLHCLPFIKLFLDTSAGINKVLLQILDKYGKELMCPPT